MAGCVLRALKHAGNVVGSTVSSHSTSITTQSAGFFQVGAWRSLSSVSVVRMAAGSEGSTPGPARPSQAAAPALHKGSGDIKPDLVRQYLSSEQYNAYELGRLKLKQVREGFATHPLDDGGSEVQIAALTEKIRYMTEHLQIHHQDKSSRRGLIAMLERRKKLLKYLRRTNGDSYGEVIYRLGLKDRSFVEDKYAPFEKKRLKKKAKNK